MPIKPISVSQLNIYIGRILASDPILMNVSVTGEISNLTKHSSGHWYFALKDKDSKINCFLSKDRVSHLRYDISEGMQIIAYGSVSLYQRGGYYSLNIRDIDAVGEGDLQIAFENLKRKLESEGLFDIEHKKSIPDFPKKIGVITSPTGAAIKDIITTVKRRNPLISILLYPCLVQGPDSAQSICDGISEMNKHKDIDVLIVGRGGGSIEDLWSFNEECVARAIYKSKIPVISAVGHEIDFVISDFVADERGATPTAAAELCSPHFDNYLDRLQQCSPQNLFEALKSKVDFSKLKIDNLIQISSNSIINIFNNYKNQLELLRLEIDSSNPLNILDKGYAVIKDSKGKWVTDIYSIKSNDQLNVILHDGTLSCIVESIEAKDGN